MLNIVVKRPGKAPQSIHEYFENLKKRESWSIDPDSKWHTVWDLFMVVLLGYVAIATPVELAFLSNDISVGYWAWNRIIDSAFMVDLVINFFLGQENPVDGKVVRDVKVISKTYLRTWFLVDLISVLPFYLMDSTVTEEFIIDNDDIATSDSLRSLQVLRLVRVLKIVRLLRASRIINRWVRHRHTACMHVHFCHKAYFFTTVVFVPLSPFRRIRSAFGLPLCNLLNTW